MEAPMARGVAGYRIGFTTNGEVSPPSVCNAKTAGLTLDAEIRAARERPDGLEVKEATATRLIIGDGRRFMRVAASEEKMVFIYRKFLPMIEDLPEGLWRGNIRRGEVLAMVRLYAS